MKFSEISSSFRCAALTRFSKAYSIEEQRCETLRTGDSPRRRGARCHGLRERQTIVRLPLQFGRRAESETVDFDRAAP